MSGPQNGLQTLGNGDRSGYTRPGRSRTLEAHRVERKLSAIFAADVEGYSRLMGQDEVGTLRTLTAYRVIIDRLIASHRGRIFNTAGDSVLADFASAVDAVECAVRLQRSCGGASSNNLLPDGPRVDFASHAASLGANSRKVASLAELEAALPEIRAGRRTSVVVIATDPTASTEAGGAWWDVAVPEISERAEVAAARAAYDAARTRQRVIG
jgi:class 3 adenylate cyclase